MSGRADLNRRPLGPEPSALAGLSHAPNACIIPQPAKIREGSHCSLFWLQLTRRESPPALPAADPLAAAQRLRRADGRACNTPVYRQRRRRHDRAFADRDAHRRHHPPPHAGE